MLLHKVNEQIELQLIELHHTAQLLELFHLNREYWRQWHPLIDNMKSRENVQRFIAVYLQQYANNGGYNAGIWFNGRLCGMIYHLNFNLFNHSTTLSYWLDELHQGKGIMTASCSTVISHAFDTLLINRISIESATENIRSLKIPERLGFRFEGIIREAEWLYDHYVDHALYSLLRSDYAKT